MPQGEDVGVEAMTRHHRAARVRGRHAPQSLKHIGEWLASRIQRCRGDGGPGVDTLKEWVAYLTEGTAEGPCTALSIHRKMAEVLQNQYPNRRGRYPNSPIVKGTSVKGLYVAADVNTMGYRSTVALLRALNGMSLAERTRAGFPGLPLRIPVMSAARADRITDISASGKHCRAHGDSEKDCRSLRHCRWAQSHCVPRTPRTRAPMGTARHQSAKKSQRDVRGIGQRLPRGQTAAGWRRAEA